MSSSQVNQTITGSEIITAGRDIINLHLATNSTAVKEPKIWKSFCTVPAPTPNFTGREDLISTIHRQIQQCAKEKEYSKKIVVIHGLGGMGKSELVRKYVQIYRQTIINAAWIDAQSKNSLESSFKSLAEELNLQTKDKQVNELAASIYKRLADHNQPSLFIFDNAEQMRSEGNFFGIFEFLPATQQDNIPLIIITTRVNNWEIPENPENIIQINELSEEAGVKFFTQRWKLSSEQKNDKAIMDALKDLARSLQCFPLGLTLAASNIKTSKLRSIPKEIKDYIQKLNVPHGGWIDERHSTGTASKYDLIMNNVWATTLEKIQSQGDDGEAAISVLNIIAYFPPDEITVYRVVKVAEFCGLLTSTAGIEMLELYSLISLLSSTPNYQPIRIHRLVQLCTRDKLDRENNYNHLLKISMFLAQDEWDDVVSQILTIHQHLKERKWPENSIQSSILFPYQIHEYSDKFEIAKDVHEVLALDEKPDCVQNLADDYKILHALNLVYLSTYNDKYKKLCEDLISNDPSYSKNSLEQVFVSSLGKCVKGLFMGTLKDLVNGAIICVLIDIYIHTTYRRILSAEVDEEIYLILADATANSFEGSVETVGELYNLLRYSYYTNTGISGSWYVETVFKIHGSVYARIKETGGNRLDSYWELDQPMQYINIQRALEDEDYDCWNTRFQESFCTEAGLQFLRQHLQYLDALTQTKIDHLPFNAISLFEFISFLGWKWNCTKEFVQANLFMETLYSVTKNLFELNAKDFLTEQFGCLLPWFGLFGKNSFVDRNGVSWSIQSVEKEMILFLDIADSADRILEVYDLDWKAKAVLKKFIESSGSDQASIAVKTATQMLKYF